MGPAWYPVQDNMQRRGPADDKVMNKLLQEVQRDANRKSKAEPRMQQGALRLRVRLGGIWVLHMGKCGASQPHPRRPLQSAAAPAPRVAFMAAYQVSAGFSVLTAAPSTDDCHVIAQTETPRPKGVKTHIQGHIP